MGSSAPVAQRVLPPRSPRHDRLSGAWWVRLHAASPGILERTAVVLHAGAAAAHSILERARAVPRPVPIV